MTTFLSILLIIAVVWYFLSKRNPQRFAPFLSAPYGKKRGLICIAAIFAIGFVGSIVNPQLQAPAQKETVQQKDDSPTGRIKSGTAVDDAHAAKILDAVHAVGIKDYDFRSVQSYESGKHDTDTEKVYVLDTPAKTFLYLDHDGNVLEIRANAKNLYKNGRAVMQYNDSF